MIVLLLANLLSHLTSAYLPPVCARQVHVSHTHSVINISKFFPEQLTGHSSVKKIKWYLRTAPKTVFGPK
jgi:hypothetical protein